DAVRSENAIDYVGDSYTSFGNDGQHLNSSVNYSGNRAVRDEVANALYNASDHLPVYAEFEISATDRIGPDYRPQKFALYQNYPNPFNSSTTLEYFVPTKGEVEVNIYNLTGNIVTTIQRHHNSSGQYSLNWDPKDENGNYLSSGIYFYQIRFSDYSSQMRKMILMK
ncbi:MAG: T9SS type A sorting domain-containing protein, partial [Candidatus Marinimicrobia bacterium]|nr:T9SS type A sorting domain-containing protein [Candidatus Neomarinimicrobiota bacterium]